MSVPIHLNVYSDALVVLGTAGILVPLLRRWRVNPVLGYLGAGALLGPLGLGRLVLAHPWLYWCTVAAPDGVSGIAELGIVFLMFLIGLEMSFQRLRTMRRLVLGLGGLQVLLSTVALAAIALTLHARYTTALILGLSLSLSSTAIVLELLSKQQRMSTGVGRISFAVLLAQDLTVIPLMIFISLAGSDAHASLLQTLLTALMQAAVAITIIVVAGRLLMRRLFRMVAGTLSSDLFIAAVFFVIIAAGVIASLAGLSMSLGAFVTGLLLAETEYRKVIHAVVEPFKGLLLGIFFFTIGMSIDAAELLEHPLWLIGAVLALLLVKALLFTLLCRGFRISWRVAIETGLLLGPGGEFAFVAIGLATASNVLEAQLSDFILATVAFSMALTPLLAHVARRLTPHLPAPAPAEELSACPPAEARQVLVIGYGRVGRFVSSILQQNGIASIAADCDPALVTRLRREGHDVYFGNASHPEFLRACGLETARCIILTLNPHAIVDQIVNSIRALRPDLPIVARARDAEHARHLYAIGSNVAVPETIEASLQLSEAALVQLDVPEGAAALFVDGKRTSYRQMLQKAAAEGSHSFTPDQNENLL